MIRYILGKSGAGKTKLALQEFNNFSDAIFIGLEEIDTSNKRIINFGDLYRKNLEVRETFNDIMFERIQEIIKLNPSVVFLDEFQLYATKKLSELIIKSKLNFCIIHQFPNQIEKIFPIIWNHADEKFLLNPYQPSKYYSL